MAGVMSTPKMVQSTIIDGGRTVLIGTNSIAWNRKHVVIFASDSYGTLFSLIRVSYMANYIKVVYLGNNPADCKLSFGYTQSGNDVKVYMKSGQSTGTYISVNIIGFDVFQSTTDTWSTDLTPTKIS